MLRLVVEHLADRGIKCVCYVDDFLISSPVDKIHKDREYVIALLQDLGFSINYEKSKPYTWKQETIYWLHNWHHKK